MKTLTLVPRSGEQNHAQNLLRCALEYARRSWPVLPLHSPSINGCSCKNKDCSKIGKHPRTHHGLKDASTDAAVIRRWWNDWPEANIGIRTGSKSGIAVLDVDGEIGRESLESLSAPPQTSRVLTGRGAHYYFLYPQGVTLKNSQEMLGKGLDVRGDCGYVVAPPSRHVNGRVYEWEDEEETLADLPNWITEKAKSLTRMASPPTRLNMEFIYKGSRDPHLFACANRWRRKASSPDELMQWLNAENLRACVPPREDEHIIGLANRAMSWPNNGPDLLERTMMKVNAEGCLRTWDRFISLCRHLRVMVPGQTILLPVERIGELMGCHPTLISRHRRRAVNLGLIEEVEKYVFKEKATKYRIIFLPEPWSH